MQVAKFLTFNSRSYFILYNAYVKIEYEKEMLDVNFPASSFTKKVIQKQFYNDSTINLWFVIHFRLSYCLKIRIVISIVTCSIFIGLVIIFLYTVICSTLLFKYILSAAKF